MTQEQIAQAIKEANAEQAIIAEKMRHERDQAAFDELSNQFTELAKFKRRMKLQFAN